MLGEAILREPYEGNSRFEWCSCVVNLLSYTGGGVPMIAPNLMKIRMREFIFLSWSSVESLESFLYVSVSASRSLIFLS